MSDRHVYNLAYYQKNKEKLKADTKAYRLKNLKKVKLCIRRALYGKFGWTLEWHRAQLTRYKRCCAICLKRKVLCVDHKGKKHAIACLALSMTIPKLYKEQPDTLYVTGKGDP